jgi:hypothetical protein
MGAPIPARLSSHHLLNVLAFVQIVNENGDKKRITNTKRGCSRITMDIFARTI